MSDGFEILEWDSNFFGFLIAKVTVSSDSTNQWKNILTTLKAKKKIRLVYWSVKPNFYDFQQFAMNNGGKLVDNKITYSI